MPTNKKHRPPSIPPHAHPLTKRLFTLMREQKVHIEDLAFNAGLRVGTVHSWRTRSNPTVDCLEAAANVLGYELQLVKKKK